MMKGSIRFAFFTVVAATTSSMSCGGGSGGTCSLVAGCGGDIVGNWRITASCLTASGTLGIPACPNATVSTALQIAGTAGYTAALTYTLAFLLSGTETIGFPGTCITSSGIAATCDELNQMFAAAPPDPTFSTVHCSVASGNGCNCVATLNGTMSNETGTYVTSGASITTTPAGSPPDPANGYCVKGNQLDLTAPPSMLEGLTTSGDLTFTRQ